MLVFLRLAEIGENGQQEGRLAESWEHSEDYRIWTIHLRRGVNWHDGVPVTAHDIKFTIDLWKHPDVMYESGVPIRSAEVIDDHTCTITFYKLPAYGNYWFPMRIGFFYPKHLLEDLDPKEFYTWDFWKHPIGNGPFRFVRYVPQTLMEFAANPEYYGGKPKIERVILKFGTKLSEVTELLSGNVDGVNYFTRTDLAKLAGNPNFRVYWEIWDDIGAPMVIYWNQKNPLFTDKKVRQALTLATNRQELPQVINMTTDIPIIDTVYTERQYWNKELPKPYPYDPKRAIALLKEAGWEDTDGNGIVDRQGREFRFTILASKWWKSAAIYVQANLREVGVRMEVLTVETDLLLERLFNGSFDAVQHWIWTGVAPGVKLSIAKFLGMNSPIGFENAHVSELLSSLEETMVLEDQDAVYHELMPIIQEEQPWTYLIITVMPYVAHRRVRGLSTPFRANVVQMAEHLWIEEENY
jgi:peptide/nickel transport system substrate-binding protein